MQPKVTKSTKRNRNKRENYILCIWGVRVNDFWTHNFWKFGNVLVLKIKHLLAERSKKWKKNAILRENHGVKNWGTFSSQVHFPAWKKNMVGEERRNADKKPQNLQEYIKKTTKIPFYSSPVCQADNCLVFKNQSICRSLKRPVASPFYSLLSFWEKLMEAATCPKKNSTFCACDTIVGVKRKPTTNPKAK